MSEENRRRERIDHTTYLVGSVEVLKAIVVRLLADATPPAPGPFPEAPAGGGGLGR